MDNLLAAALVGLLGLRFAPWLTRIVLPTLYRRYEARLARWLALLDVASGTLMLILIGWLLVQRAWILAVVFGLLVLPSVRALFNGLRTLVGKTKRTPDED